MAALTAKAEEMGRETAFSATQAAEGLNILAMSGYDAESSIGMIENVLNMASAGGLELSQAASYVAGSMKGFTAEAEIFADVTEASAYYSNMIAKGATLAATDVNQLGAALSQASATANTYGQTSQSTAAALLRLAEQNVTGEAAATALAAAMKNLYSPTDTAKGVLEELGVSAYDAQGKARDFNAVVDDLYGALSQISDGSVRADLENAIFGIQGQAAFDKMVASSGDKVQQFYDGLAGAGGAVQSMEQLGIAVHDVDGNLRSTADIAADLRNALADMTPDEQESAIRQIFNTDDFEYVDRLLNDTSGNFEAFGSIIENSTGSAAMQAEAMLDNLSGRVTLFQSAAEGFYNALYKGVNEPLKDMVDLGSGYVTQLTEAFEKNGFDGLADALGSALADAASKIASYLPQVVKLGLSIITSLVRGIKQNAPALASAAIDIGTALVEGLFGFTADLLDLGASLLVSLADGIIEHLPEITVAAQTVIADLTQSLADNLPLIITAGIDIITALADAFSENIDLIVTSALTVMQVLCESLLNGENLQKLLDAGLNLLTSLAQAIIDNLPLLIDIALQILTFLCTELLAPDNLMKLVDAAFQIVTALVDAIIDNIDELLLAVEQIITALCDNLCEPGNLERLVKTGAELLGKLIVGLCEVGGKLLGFALDLFGEIRTALVEMDWLGIGKSIIEGIISGLTDSEFVLPDLGAFGDILLKGIKSIFGIHSPSKVMHDEVGEYLALGIGEGFADEAAAIGQRITQTVSGWTAGLSESVSSAAQRVTQGFAGIFAKLPAEVQKPLTDAGAALKSWGVSAAETGKNAAVQFVDGIMGFANMLPVLAKQPLHETLDQVLSWGASLVQRGKDAAQNLVSTIVRAVSTLPDTMAGIGANLVSGLWNGITNMGGWLRDRITGFAGSIIAGFKDTFGIASPSKVMRDNVGKYLAQGLGIGFTQEIPEIGKDALKAFSDLELPALTMDVPEIVIPDVDPVPVRFDTADVPEYSPIPVDYVLPELPRLNPDPPDGQPKPGGIRLPRADSEAVRGFRTISANSLNASGVQPSPTSSVINNSYTYNMTNSNPSDSNPVQPVNNFYATFEVSGEKFAEYAAERVDLIQGESVTFDERGTAH